MDAEHEQVWEYVRALAHLNYSNENKKFNEGKSKSMRVWVLSRNPNCANVFVLHRRQTSKALFQTLKANEFQIGILPSGCQTSLEKKGEKQTCSIRNSLLRGRKWQSEKKTKKRQKKGKQRQTHSTHGDSERRRSGGCRLHGRCALVRGPRHTAAASCPFWRRLWTERRFNVWP